VDADGSAEATHAGNVTATDGVTDGFVVEAEVGGELLDGEDGGRIGGDEGRTFLRGAWTCQGRLGGVSRVLVVRRLVREG
jgi:hypothetical protein